jgi:hypothetical protein
MRNIDLRKGFIAATGSALLGLMLATVANAANPEPAVVEVEWVAAITIAKSNNLQFGLLDTAMAENETVVIAPGGGVTDADNNIAGGTQAAATFNTTAAPSQGITIQAINITGGTYYSLGTFRCIYDGGTEGDCSAAMNETSAAGSRVVQVGATLTRNATVSPTGQDNGSFDLQMAYQ